MCVYVYIVCIYVICVYNMCITFIVYVCIGDLVTAGPLAHEVLLRRILTDSIC